MTRIYGLSFSQFRFSHREIRNLWMSGANREIKMEIPKNKKPDAKVLIVEGGGMRGAFAGGALAAMCKIYPVKNFDLVLGVSAGSCSLAYYVTEDRRYFPSLQNIPSIWKNELHGKKFISFWNYLKGSTLLNQKYLIDHIISRKYRVNTEKLKRKISVPFYVVVSNIIDLTPEYVKISSENVFQVLRAATALPIATKGKHKIGEKLYSDGGIIDPIPIEAVVKAGYKNITLILNHSRSYLAKPLNRFLANISFPFHPKVRHYLKEIHHENYNRAKMIINNPPKGVNIEIIDPQESLPVGLTTTHRNHLVNLFDHGWEVAEKFFKEKMGQLKNKTKRR